jgi:hypothetical protein
VGDGEDLTAGVFDCRRRSKHNRDQAAIRSELSKASGRRSGRSFALDEVFVPIPTKRLPQYVELRLVALEDQQHWCCHVDQHASW